MTQAADRTQHEINIAECQCCITHQRQVSAGIECVPFDDLDRSKGQRLGIQPLMESSRVPNRKHDRAQSFDHQASHHGVGDIAVPAEDQRSLRRVDLAAKSHRVEAIVSCDDP
jgi:hypothetical protein